MLQQRGERNRHVSSEEIWMNIGAAGEKAIQACEILVKQLLVKFPSGPRVQECPAFELAKAFKNINKKEEEKYFHNPCNYNLTYFREKKYNLFPADYLDAEKFRCPEKKEGTACMEYTWSCWKYNVIEESMLQRKKTSLFSFESLKMKIEQRQVANKMRKYSLKCSVHKAKFQELSNCKCQGSGHYT